jgi:hypothetical protein
MLGLMWHEGQPAIVLLGSLAMILVVPVKMLIDRPRRAHLESGHQRPAG